LYVVSRSPLGESARQIADRRVESVIVGYTLKWDNQPTINIAPLLKIPYLLRGEL